MKDSSPALEFSRPFPVDKLRDKPAREKFEAHARECEALARRLNLLALKSLEADLTLTRVQSMVEVSGSFAAHVVQNCVVTLEPFESNIAEHFLTFFAPAAPVKDGDMPLEDEHAPEPIPANGEIDLGELVAQHLSLALDPYPRKPGAVFNAVEEEDEKPSPFSVLADYRAGKTPKKK
ncbi:MAG TPA: DUF177 domain-containing protein [Alphaproteobacteria bacterium]|nr:DUF177 domain-containing protein [Alphaproteobacteria bacterium]